MDAFGSYRPGMMPSLGSGSIPGLMGMAELPYAQQQPSSNEGLSWGAPHGDAAASLPGPPGPSKEGSVFYKTRLCHKFAEGHCPFGDRCSYAHGEAELRNPPQDGQMLDLRSRGGAPGGPPPMPPRADAKHVAGKERGGVRSTPFKSRLCTRFMQKGECPYGPSCHFAHGYEDMQPAESHGPGPPSMDGAGFEMQFPRPGMPMMPPGGPMLPPEFMAMAAMGGMGPGMMPPRPRPPPGPPPGVPPSGGPPAMGGGPSFSPDRQGFVFDVTRTPTRLPSDVPYRDRVRAACVLLKVGRLAPRDAGIEAMEAALAAIQSGEAFEANAYADALRLGPH